MIITISQTASNLKQSYDVTGEGFYYSGNAGSVSRLQPITLSSKDNTIKGVYRPSKWTSHLPLCHWFGVPNITREFQLSKNGQSHGTIVLSKHGFLKSNYAIALDGGESFHCYFLSRASYNYVSIYRGETQIALVETYLSVNDYKYTHKLYLLEEYRPYADVLSFFVIYYASYHFARRMHMTLGSIKEKSWSASRNADKYDPHWREKHFPEENFFGKTDPFDLPS